MAGSHKPDRVSAGSRNRSCGLVLDDCLNQFADVRRRFRLTTPASGLRQIEAEAGVKRTLGRVVTDIIDRHGSDIYSDMHPLLAELGKKIYAEPINTRVYSGNQIRQDCVSQTLRRVIEVGLQTIVQLPSREAKTVPVPNRLKSVALALSRSSEKLDEAISNPEVRRRIELWGDQTGLAKVLAMPDEIRWGVDALNAVAGLKVTRVRMNSPNPQTSLAMYFVGWIRVATGTPHYEDLTMLLQAAFSAAGKSTPRWVDRLPIEMHGRKKWRKKWINTISS